MVTTARALETTYVPQDLEHRNGQISPRLPRGGTVPSTFVDEFREIDAPHLASAEFQANEPGVFRRRIAPRFYRIAADRVSWTPKR